MKKKILIPIVAVMVLATVVNIRIFMKRNHIGKLKMELFAEMPVQKMADIHTKRMAFHLDLSEKQIDEVTKINLEVAKFRKAKLGMLSDRKGKPTSEEIYQIMSIRLDQQLELKQDLKEILSIEQMSKMDELWMHNLNGNRYSNLKH